MRETKTRKLAYLIAYYGSSTILVSYGRGVTAKSLWSL